jgi:hypothetical protein
VDLQTDVGVDDGTAAGICTPGRLEVAVVETSGEDDHLVDEFYLRSCRRQPRQQRFHGHRRVRRRASGPA